MLLPLNEPIKSSANEREQHPKPAEAARTFDAQGRRPRILSEKKSMGFCLTKKKMLTNVHKILLPISENTYSRKK